MALLENKTKAQLIELIQQKENEILDLKDELRELKKCKKYENITDEIKDVHDKLIDRGFTDAAANDIVMTMISAQQIPARPTFPTRYGQYVSYR